MGRTVSRDVDRRRAERRRAEAIAPRLTLALRAGPTVEVVDLSSIGALVETAARLEPGTKVAIRSHLDGARVGVASLARVVHCRVWSIERLGGIRFRAGLQFDAGSDYTTGERSPTPGKVLPRQSGYGQGALASRGHPVDRRWLGTFVD